MDPLTPLDEYSLWLEPVGVVRDRLKALITQLGNEAASPVFEPHVTLLGGLQIPEQEIIQKMRTLVQKRKPPAISFLGIHTPDASYKSICIHCIETNDLMRLNQEAQKIFSMKTSYTPHLSLLYRNISPDSKELLKRKLPDDLIQASTFTPPHISLWHARGTAEEWCKVAEVSFLS